MSEVCACPSQSVVGEDGKLTIRLNQFTAHHLLYTTLDVGQVLYLTNLNTRRNHNL